MLMLLVYLFFAIAISFLCSMLEAVLLSVPKSHIAALVERGDPTGERLRRMKNDIDQPLAAILTLNTFAHTLGAAGVGAQAAFIWGDAWVGVVSFVVTLLILIFSEIIPKTLGAVHAKRLAPFVAWTTGWLMIVLKPVVVVCNKISLLISGRAQVKAGQLSREEMIGLAGLALEEGALDHTEAEVLRNLVTMNEMKVEHIMTPRTVVYSLPADMSVREVSQLTPPQFSRIPVVRGSLDDPAGIVHRREIYRALAEGQGEKTLGDLTRPLHIIPEAAPLPRVLRTFIKRQEHLFLVVDEYGSSVGIVTLEDVLESLLGVEIIDETDSVADMQQLARERVSERGTGETGD